MSKSPKKKGNKAETKTTTASTTAEGIILKLL